MTSLHDRIRERLNETGKTPRKAGLDGGLSPDAIGKMLKNPSQSQTLETIYKLAVGLNTTAEWLAFGLETQTEHVSDGSTPATIAASLSNAPLYKSHLRDTDYIQVEKGTLRRLLLEALLAEDLPTKTAEAYADGVLGFLEEHQDATVVVRLTASARTASGSPAPALVGPS